MYELKKNVNVFTSKFVGTGPSSYEKRIYRAAVSQRLRNTGLDYGLFRPLTLHNNAFFCYSPKGYTLSTGNLTRHSCCKAARAK